MVIQQHMMFLRCCVVTFQHGALWSTVFVYLCFAMEQGHPGLRDSLPLKRCLFLGAHSLYAHNQSPHVYTSPGTTDASVLPPSWGIETLALAGRSPRSKPSVHPPKMSMWTWKMSTVLFQKSLSLIFSNYIPGVSPNFTIWIHMAIDQYLLIPFSGGWTSIYQLFWCELQGYRVLTHCHINKY